MKRRSDCPISFGLDLLGDKWTLLIMRDLLLFDCHYYGDLVKYEGIATNIRADRLQRLESAGVITRTPEGARVRYDATEKGRALIPVITELMLWGIRYDDSTPVSDEFRNRIPDNRGRFAEDIEVAARNGEFVDYRRREMGVGKRDE